MASFTGVFQYLDTKGALSQSGSCRLTVERGSLRLVSDDSPPLILDPGDIDVFSSADYQLSLKLYTGNTLVLSRFGKAFQNLCHDVLEAYRCRLIRCLLLEDLKEIERFDGSAQLDSVEGACSSRAEIRLYKSNLAVLPETAMAFQWRLADIDAVAFDEPTYTLGLRSGNDRLILTKLGRRTHEFMDRLRSAMADVTERSAATVQSLFPFLTPDRFQQVSELMKEGHSAPVERLNSIDSRIGPVLLEKTVDAHLAPYFRLLVDRAAGGCYFTGFKLIRPEMEDQDAGEEGLEALKETAEEAGVSSKAPGFQDKDAEAGQEQMLHWFFFPMRTRPETNAPADLVAWESTSHVGRATYFFRLPLNSAAELLDPARAPAAIESAILRLNKALVLLNFKREPIYLPDESIEKQPRYRRYAIACRRIPVLRQLRASYAGRALHTSPEAWLKQLQSIFAKI